MIYSGLIRIRNLLYDHSWLKSHNVNARVVSVGNLTVGGTGKTPLVHLIAEEAQRRGLSVGVVARGYKGRLRGGRLLNDEGIMLSQKLPSVVVIQDPDRVAAAQKAVSHQGVGFLVLDDGFQHRRLSRNLDILSVDATLPFGFGRVLPAGLLREPLTGLKRAGAIVLTRCDQVSPQRLDEVEKVLRDMKRVLPLFKTRHEPVLLRSVDGSERLDPDAISGIPVYLVCGIANPLAFENTLSSLGARVLGRSQFPDHHEYTAEDMDSLQRKAESCGAEKLVTTAKDGVKLSLLNNAREVLVLEVQLRFQEKEKAFWNLVFNPDISTARNDVH